MWRFSDGQLEVSLGASEVTRPERHKRESLERADMARVTFERRVPGSDGSGVLTLVRTNAPEQVMGISMCRVVGEPGDGDRCCGFELTALTQALAQFEKGESLWA